MFLKSWPYQDVYYMQNMKDTAEKCTGQVTF